MSLTVTIVGKEKTMITPHKKVLSVCTSILGAGLLSLTNATAEPDGNLFPEGAFEMETTDSAPEGWGIPNKLDLPWKAGAILDVIEESEGKFARITTVPEYPGFYALSATLPIPEGVTKFKYSIKMRCKMEKVKADWTGYQLHIGFATEQGTGPGTRGFNVENSKNIMSITENIDEWETKEGEIVCPPNAKFLAITIMINGMLGTFDLDDLKIYPVNP